MKVVCFCGRVGEIEDREPILDGDGREALRCTHCGHLDYLSWLSDRDRLFEEARRRADEQRVFTA